MTRLIVVVAICWLLVGAALFTWNAYAESTAAWLSTMLLLIAWGLGLVPIGLALIITAVHAFSSRFAVPGAPSSQARRGTPRD